MTELAATPGTALQAEGYADKYVRYFSVAAVFWVIVGMSMGVYIASELAFPALNLGLEWTSFGRLRPVLFQ